MSSSRARIALFAAWIGLLLLIVVSYPHVDPLTSAYGAILSGCGVVMLCLEDRERLRRPLTGREATKALTGLVPVVLLLGLAALGVLY
jgi:hypothetical protein